AHLRTSGRRSPDVLPVLSTSAADLPLPLFRSGPPRRPPRRDGGTAYALFFSRGTVHGRARASGQGAEIMATHLMHPTTHAPQARFVVTDTHVNAALLLLGRLIFGGYFAYAGVEHFMNRAALASAAAAHGVPQPELAIIGTGLLLLAGGLSILTG